MPPGGISYMHFVELRGQGLNSTLGGDNLLLPEIRAVWRMHGVADESEMRASIKMLITALEDQRKVTTTKLWGDVGTHPQWELVDFLYFSAVTMTTLGYGDI